MANHAYIGFGNAEETGDIRGCLLVIETHDDDRPFALFQILYTANELFMVEVWHRRLDRRLEIRPKLFEQSFFPLSAAAQVEHHHPARSQHEGCEFLRFTQATSPQSFERRDQNLLRKVLGGLFVPQVTQTIEPNAWSHPAEQLGFSFAVASGADLPHQLSIVQANDHQHTFYV